MAYTTIDKPSDYFNTVLYTSNNGSSPRTISGVGFQPDFVWVKNRDDANYNHVLNDSVRGLNKILSSDTTGAELAANHAGGYISSANSDGFVVTAGSSNLSNYDTGTNKQVVWNWLASNSTASNEDGSITSTVSANTTSGFSIVSWTAGSGVGSIGHGLGGVPDLIISKDRDASSAWITGSHLINNWDSYLNLSSTSTPTSDVRMYHPSGQPTPSSTIFFQDHAAIGSSGEKMIAYCFRSIKGFSKFGSYTGNGNADGTFVYTGFKPAFVIRKVTSASSSWIMQDNKRSESGGFNQIRNYLFPNSSQAEVSNQDYFNIDFLSNGFKMRSTDGGANGSGSSYIYMCFAENPFVSSSGVPACAR